MKEFTFIVITYNQEQCVVEHLESIKYLVETYGCDMDIDLVIADDKSRDKTVEVINEWLIDNKKIFRNITIINREENVGTIRNIESAIKITKTEQFKFLAGDDKYNGENIFKLQKKNTLTITPVVPFGEPAEKDMEVFKAYYKLLLRHKNRKKLAKLLKYACVIPAPGVFIDSNYYRRKDLWDYLKQFRLIEDYPTWYYLLNNDEIEINVDVMTTPYIYYRMSSGMSTGNKSDIFVREEKKLIQVLGVKTERYPKYINIYKYIFVFKRYLAKKMKNIESEIIENVYKC